MLFKMGWGVPMIIRWVFQAITKQSNCRFRQEDNLDRLSGRFEKLQISNQDITSYELFFAELYLEEAEIFAEGKQDVAHCSQQASIPCSQSHISPSFDKKNFDALKLYCLS